LLGRDQLGYAQPPLKGMLFDTLIAPKRTRHSPPDLFAWACRKPGKSVILKSGIVRHGRQVGIWYGWTAVV